MVLYFMYLIDYIYAYFCTLLIITLSLVDLWFWFKSSLLAVGGPKKNVVIYFTGILWIVRFMDLRFVFCRHSPLSLWNLSGPLF